MRKVIVSFLAALAVVVLPQLLTAQDSGRPDRPRPDAKADRSAPKKAFPARPDGKFDAGKFAGRHEHANLGNQDGAKSDGFGRAIFDRLDTNHDGVLSFQEFVVGMRQLHNSFAAQWQNETANRPSGDRYQQFAGKHFDGGKRHGGWDVAQGHGMHHKHRGYGQGHGMHHKHHGHGQGHGMHHKHHGCGQGQPWRHEGHEFAESHSWRNDYREYGESRPWQRDGHEFGEGHHARPADRATASVSPRHGFDKAAVRPDFKKPECKKPEAKCCKQADIKTPAAKGCKQADSKKPEAKGYKLADGKKPEYKKPLVSSSVGVAVTAPAGGRSLEARVASLEKQQAEILGLLRSIVKSEHGDRN